MAKQARVTKKHKGETSRVGAGEEDGPSG